MKFFCDDARHLVCVPYSHDNLHAMAQQLGIKRHWFHSGRLAHYDIPKKRIAEITAQCTKVSTREILTIIMGVTRNSDSERRDSILQNP